MISPWVIERAVRGGIIVANLAIYARDVMDLAWPRLGKGFSEARTSGVSSRRERESNDENSLFRRRNVRGISKRGRPPHSMGILRESNLHKTINKTRLISVLAVTGYSVQRVCCVVSLKFRPSCVDLSRSRLQSFTLSRSSKVMGKIFTKIMLKYRE